MYYARKVASLLLWGLTVILFSVALVNAASYSRDVTETIAIGDSVESHKYSPLPEAVALSESVVARNFTPRSDNIPISDSVIAFVCRFYSVDVSADLSLGESVSVIVYKFYPVDVSADIPLVESVVARNFTPRSDNIPISDSVIAFVYRFYPLAVGDAPGYNSLWSFVNADGIVTGTCTARSFDNMCQLTLRKGITAKTRDNTPLRNVSMLQMHEPPSPPHGGSFVGLVYELGPSGATFDPPATLTFTYSPWDIPGDVPEESLAMAYWDVESGEWVDLDGVVDIENKTITAFVSHLTAFAIIAPIASPPAPATFTVSNLSIQPAKVQRGETVVIAASVTNTGGIEGTYAVVLMINGLSKGEKSVTVAAGESRSVSFAVSEGEAGSYSVVVDGLSGSFTVVARPVSPAKPPVNWPLVGGLVAGALILGLLVLFLVRRKAY